ncbi:uncharacterized protein BDR25DRAFT_362696 [Lindgomyces ingoldianus]|uniref:Uncharacterized protein n=1 Tax=Lindgomyces ingoldianus TaxID=673940 RepID=A0ACB6Q993_9PLEO|nr:uncharacterized protein BDR25DRAFT_362696 [Lindgomyces ingoldianus]KAF2463528.1 hypothetical protein BDR25DRAFT_362696 [Lindgomyces ingoldianus]
MKAGDYSPGLNCRGGLHEAIRGWKEERYQIKFYGGFLQARFRGDGVVLVLREGLGSGRSSLVFGFQSPYSLSYARREALELYKFTPLASGVSLYGVAHTFSLTTVGDEKGNKTPGWFTAGTAVSFLLFCCLVHNHNNGNRGISGTDILIKTSTRQNSSAMEFMIQEGGPYFTMALSTNFFLETYVLHPSANTPHVFFVSEELLHEFLKQSLIGALTIIDGKGRHDARFLNLLACRKSIVSSIRHSKSSHVEQHFGLYLSQFKSMNHCHSQWFFQRVGRKRQDQTSLNEGLKELLPNPNLYTSLHSYVLKSGPYRYQGAHPSILSMKSPVGPKSAPSRNAERRFPVAPQTPPTRFRLSLRPSDGRIRACIRHSEKQDAHNVGPYHRKTHTAFTLLPVLRPPDQRITAAEALPSGASGWLTVRAPVFTFDHPQRVAALVLVSFLLPVPGINLFGSRAPFTTVTYPFETTERSSSSHNEQHYAHTAESDPRSRTIRRHPRTNRMSLNWGGFYWVSSCFLPNSLTLVSNVCRLVASACSDPSCNNDNLLSLKLSSSSLYFPPASNTKQVSVAMDSQLATRLFQLDSTRYPAYSV